MNAELEACNGITAGQADEYHATAGGRVFSWIDGRLGPVGHANLKIMQSTQAGISRPCGNALWTHGTDHSSKFPTAGKIPDYATTFPVAVERDLTSQTLPRAGSLTSATPDSTGPYSEVAGEELL